MTESDPAEDVAIVEVDGRMVGYGRAGWREEVGGLRVYDVNPLVDATDDVLTAVIDVLEARIRTIAAGHPAGKRSCRPLSGPPLQSAMQCFYEGATSRSASPT